MHLAVVEDSLRLPPLAEQLPLRCLRLKQYRFCDGSFKDSGLALRINGYFAGLRPIRMVGKRGTSDTGGFSLGLTKLPAPKCRERVFSSCRRSQ